MKRWMLIACLIGLVALTTGCDRREPDRPESYDAQVDGPPGPTPPAPNPMLMKRPDQTVPDEAIGGGTTGGGAIAQPTGTPVEQVRQVLEELQQAARTGEVQVIAARLGGDGGRELGELFRTAASAAPQMRQFAEYVRNELGIEPPAKYANPDDVKAQAAQGTSGMDIDLARAEFRREGEKVIVTHPEEDEPLEFVQEGGRWVILVPLDEQTRQMLPMMKAMFSVPQKVMAEARAGIESGEITAENFQAKLEEIESKYAGQIMGEMFRAGMGEGDGTGEGE
jgi:hypothetical protein